MVGRWAGQVFAAALAAFAGAAALSSTAHAQPLDDKYWIEVSGFYASADTRVNVSRPGRPGTDIDMESNLGLKKHETLPALYGGWRLGRWVINGEYYALDRNGSRATTRDIEFDGVTFPANVAIDSKMRSNVYRATVGYSFIRNDKAELGAAIGLHATDFTVRLRGDAQVAGSAARQTEDRRHSFLAPLPTVGVYGTYEVTPKVILTGRVDYLSMKIDEYDGSILNAQAALSYRISRMIELGLAYRYVDYSLDVDKSSYQANIDYDFNGPSAFIRFGFR